MQQLTSSQAKYVRGLAHSLKPVVFVGQKGITATVLETIHAALDTH
jgi:RNA-binding protein